MKFFQYKHGHHIFYINLAEVSAIKIETQAQKGDAEGYCLYEVTFRYADGPNTVADLLASEVDRLRAILGSPKAADPALSALIGREKREQMYRGFERDRLMAAKTNN